MGVCVDRLRSQHEDTSWLTEGFTASNVFPEWGRVTNGITGAIAGRDVVPYELGKEKGDPDAYYNSSVHNHAVFFTRRSGMLIDDLIRYCKKLRLILDTCEMWTSGSAAVSQIVGLVLLDQIEVIDRPEDIMRTAKVTTMVSELLTILGASNCVSVNTNTMADNISKKIGNRDQRTRNAIGFLELMTTYFKTRNNGSFPRYDAALASTRPQKWDYSKVGIEKAELGTFGYTYNTTPESRPIRAWKFDGILYMTILTRDGRYGFVLDRDHVAMLLERLLSVANVREWAKVYRVSGQNGGDPMDISPQVKIMEKWVGDRIRRKYPEEDVKLAKIMKTSLAICENNFHRHAVRMDTGEERRSLMLMQEVRELGDENLECYNMLTSLGMPDRTVLDMAYFFHVLPTPDRDIVKLCVNTHAKMHEPRGGKRSTQDEFIEFCQTMDYLKAFSETGNVPNHKRIRYGTAEEEAELLRLETLASKKICGTPSKLGLGLVQLHKQFPYVKHANVAHLAAKDVTRVPADMKEYFENPGTGKERRVRGNEVLSSLINGDKVYKGMTMEEFREGVEAGTVEFDNIADITAKAENTKDADTARETLSLNEPMRFLMSEMDKNSAALAALYKEIAMGASVEGMDRAFKKYNEFCCCATGALCISTDISGWSPKADREFFLRHHNMLLEYTTKEGTFNFTNAFEGLKFVSRRGNSRIIMEILQGMVQGWTGRCDCLLHAHILYYVAWRLREEEYMAKGERFQGRVQIDDSLFAFLFKMLQMIHQDQDHCQEVFDEVVRVYDELGLIVATDKTIVSTILYTFLNRFFAEGSEVAKPLRTMMKIGPNPDVVINTFHGQVQEIVGTARGSLEKGSDPLVVYVFALRKTLETAMKWDNTVLSMPGLHLAVTLLAPTSMGGWGFPAYIDFCTKEKTDPMRPVNVLVHKVATENRDPSAVEGIKRVISALYCGGFRVPNVWSLLSAPQVPTFEGILDCSGHLRAVVRRVISEIGACQEVKSSLAVECDKAIVAAMWEVLSSCTMDPSAFEQLAKNKPFASYAALVETGRTERFVGYP